MVHMLDPTEDFTPIEEEFLRQARALSDTLSGQSDRVFAFKLYEQTKERAREVHFLQQITHAMERAR